MRADFDEAKKIQAVTNKALSKSEEERHKNLKV
jgi:hypothetical protein